MSWLLKSLSPSKDAVAVSIAANALIQELWEGRSWVNPRVFLKSAQAALACLTLQGLGEEDSKQSIELQWIWEQAPLKALYATSLFQGAVRTSYSWIGADDAEELPPLNGRAQLRRTEDLFEFTGIVESEGDVVKDVQDILLKSEQKDCALAVSVRWDIVDEPAPKLIITRAHAYLVHVLPPPFESGRGELLAHWHNFLRSLRSPAEWALSDDPKIAVREMNSLLLASNKTQDMFSKPLMFFCSCTQQKIESVLRTLPKEDLLALDEVIEISCKYCDRIYLVDKSKSGLA